MKLQIVGNCPDCGAPVYGAKSCEGKKKPRVTYSCECRNKETYELRQITIIPQPQPYPIYIERPSVPAYPYQPWGPTYPTWGTGSTALDTSDTCIMGAGGADAIARWARQ